MAGPLENFRRRDGSVHVIDETKTLFDTEWIILRSPCGVQVKHNPVLGPRWDRATNDKVTCIMCLAGLG